MQGPPAQYLAGLSEARVSPSAARACRKTCAPRSHLAKTHDVDLPMQAAIAPSNRAHIDLAIAKVMATGKRRIGMIGLSFKTGTDDLRESPLVLLAEHFIGKGCTLLVYDPEVHLSNLLGANRRYIEQHLPHIGSADPQRHRGGDRGVRRAGHRPRRSRRRRRPREAHSARADNRRSDQGSRSQGYARAIRGVVLVNVSSLVIANAIALAIALGWLAYLTLPYAQAVRVRNAFLLRRGRPEDFSWTPAAVPGDFRSERMTPPNAIRGAVESAGVAKLADDWPARARAGADAGATCAAGRGHSRRSRNDLRGHRSRATAIARITFASILPPHAAPAFSAGNGPFRSTASAGTATRSSRSTTASGAGGRSSTCTTTFTRCSLAATLPVDALALRRALLGDPASIEFRRAGPGRLGFS